MFRPPSRFQQRTIWTASTGVAILVIFALLVGLIWLIGKILGVLQPVLIPLAVAGIVAYLLDPFVRWFQKRGLSRLRSVMMVFGCAVAAFCILLAIMIPQVGNQIDEFRRNQDSRAAAGNEQAPTGGEQAPAGGEQVPTGGEQAPTGGERAPTGSERAPAGGEQAVGGDELIAGSDAPGFQAVVVRRLKQLRDDHKWLRAPIDHLLEERDDLPQASASGAIADPAAADTLPTLQDTRMWQYWSDYADDLARSVFGWVKGGTGKVMGALGLVIGFMMVPIYLYYFLKESSSIKEHWHEYVPLRASKLKDELVDVIAEINGYLISFFRGQVVVAFIDGILVGIALSLFGLPLGLLIGIMMAVLGVIPYIGNIICLIPACALAYFHFGDHPGWLGTNPWAYVLGVIVIFVVVQQINSLVTAPKIVGDSVGLHPMTVIFSMIFWSLLLGGFIGALLAVPLTASVKVLFRRYIWQKRIADGPEPEPA